MKTFINAVYLVGGFFCLLIYKIHQLHENLITPLGTFSMFSFIGVCHHWKTNIYFVCFFSFISMYWLKCYWFVMVEESENDLSNLSGNQVSCWTSDDSESDCDSLREKEEEESYFEGHFIFKAWQWYKINYNLAFPCLHFLVKFTKLTELESCITFSIMIFFFFLYWKFIAES